MLKMKRTGVTLPPLIKKTLKYLKVNLVVVLCILVVLALLFVMFKQTEGLENDLLNEKTIKNMLSDSDSPVDE